LRKEVSKMEKLEHIKDDFEEVAKSYVQGKISAFECILKHNRILNTYNLTPQEYQTFMKWLEGKAKEWDEKRKLMRRTRE